jgi:hypothetical protein
MSRAPDREDRSPGHVPLAHHLDPDLLRAILRLFVVPIVFLPVAVPGVRIVGIVRFSTLRFGVLIILLPRRLDGRDRIVESLRVRQVVDHVRVADRPVHARPVSAPDGELPTHVGEAPRRKRRVVRIGDADRRTVAPHPWNVNRVDLHSDLRQRLITAGAHAQKRGRR